MKRNLIEKQIELQCKIIALTNVNVVTCGHCGSVLFHELNDNPIDCAFCESQLDQCDCPDLFYVGMEINK